ncbi:MAG: class II fructose-bisphosphate aldolase [Gammaproteobacteria bacterium]|nr:class II fructose-bisphosphate aldolase [Gammaproteobacteria bacterium]
MLTNLKELLSPAMEKGYAVACFNVFGYEDAVAVVNAAESRNASVILSINLDMLQFMPLQHIASTFRAVAESAKVPVCLHLDHNYEIDTVKKAIDYGFTSVMYDCSQLPIAENIAGIREVVDYAAKVNVSVEAEVGSVPYASGRDHIKSALTEIGEALAMIDQGKPAALAISVGNVHRIENAFVDIDFDHFYRLANELDTPLVIHGTSGIRSDDIQKLAKEKVCKFNIGTCLRQRFGNALRQTLEADNLLFDRLSIMKKVIPEVSDEACRMIKLLGQ